jgi:hypothetical protein
LIFYHLLSRLKEIISNYFKIQENRIYILTNYFVEHINKCNSVEMERRGNDWSGKHASEGGTTECGLETESVSAATKIKVYYLYEFGIWQLTITLAKIKRDTYSE